MKFLTGNILYPLLLFVIIAFHLPAQTDTRILNGVPYKIITPEEFASNADAGRFSWGERYVIDDVVMGVNGTKLTMMNTGTMNSFILSQPAKLKMMQKIRLYVQITKINNAISNFVEARIDRLEGARAASQFPQSNSARYLDGVSYTIFTPEEFDFYADAGQIKAGERYVIDDAVLAINGTKLTLANSGVMNSFILSQPLKLDKMTQVRVYVEITRVNSTITNFVDANIIKLEVLN